MRTGRPSTARTPCGRSAAARSGQRGSAVTPALATAVLFTNASARALPGFAFYHLKHSPFAVGRGDIAGNILPIGQHDAARDTGRDPRMPRSHGAGLLQHWCLAWPSAASRMQTSSQGVRINRHGLPDSCMAYPFPRLQ